MTEREKGNETVFGIVSLILGLVSLMLFCVCINWVTGTIAIVFGVIQLAKNKERGLALGGIVTAGLSLFLSLVLCVCLAMGIKDAGMTYGEFLREYLPDGIVPGPRDGGDGDDYDDYDDYDDGYDYYDDYGEGGQEFL